MRAIAVAQTVPVAGNVDANLAEHLRIVEAATGERPDVIVFPELSLTGYELERAPELAFTEDDRRLDPLAEASRTSHATLVVGAPLREGADPHIAAVILRPDGSRDAYTKRHLGTFPPDAGPGGTVPPAEGTVFKPGDRDPLLRVGDARAAVAVCADVGHASHAVRASERGADCYLASMFVIPQDIDCETERLRRRARDHAMLVAMANFGGPSGGLAAAGRSSIWSSGGEMLVRLGARGAGAAGVVLDGDGWRPWTRPLG